MSAERPSVLIVEDERELADLYGEWLEMAGCSVRTAHDGRAALEYLDSEVDVVLLDRRLPEIRGKQVLEGSPAVVGRPDGTPRHLEPLPVEVGELALVLDYQHIRSLGRHRRSDTGLGTAY